MLYQKGEKLKELRQTIKEIPMRSDLKQTDFVMSKKALKSFEAPILKLFHTLNAFLFNTLISNKSKIDKCNDIVGAVDNVIAFLDENYQKDMQDYFYEEKLEIYEKMFVILVEDQLCKRFSEYKDVLDDISKAYWRNKENSETKFLQISALIGAHKEITEDMDNGIYDSTATYLEHSIEMIYEEISELIKAECEMHYLNPDVLPNRLRQLIYLLKSELPNVFEENDEDEE